MKRLSMLVLLIVLILLIMPIVVFADTPTPEPVPIGTPIPVASTQQVNNVEQPDYVMQIVTLLLPLLATVAAAFVAIAKPWLAQRALEAQQALDEQTAGMFSKLLEAFVRAAMTNADLETGEREMTWVVNRLIGNRIAIAYMQRIGIEPEQAANWLRAEANAVRQRILIEAKKVASGSDNVQIPMGQIIASDETQ